MRWWSTLLLALAMSGAGCLEHPEEPDDNPPALDVGESRTVEIWAIRLDVTNVEEVVTKDDILSLPDKVRANLWLYDLDLTGKSGTPRLLDNAMAQIRSIPLSNPDLTPAERNMIRLLNMTPDTADLRRTRMEELLGIAPKVGFAAAEVLADAAGIGVEDAFLSDQAVTEAVLDNVIGTHPNAQLRRGRKTADNPEGLYPVARGHLPVSLEDAASDMASAAVRFGPYQEGGVYHPGFIVGTTKAQVLSDDFKMILKANANALPFKGVDLTNATRGSVSSIGRDSTLFDFSDPDWLRIEGLNDDVVIERMEFQILEYPELLGPSTSPLPAPWGNSPVWLAPPWTLERVVADAGYLAFGERQYARDYFLKDPNEPLFHVSIDDGWMAIETVANLGSPPPPLYMWDLMAEVAQVRLHDGPDPKDPSAGQIPEGQAHVKFTLRDVPIGVTSDQISDAIRRNLEEDPSGLISAASSLLDQAFGAPDFFYYRPRADSPAEVQGDWLYYITAEDIPLDAAGDPVRDPAAYATPGFFADAELTQKVSSKLSVDGDLSHEKVRIEVGDVLYASDDAGGVFRIELLSKSGPVTMQLKITRVK